MTRIYLSILILAVLIWSLIFGLIPWLVWGPEGESLHHIIP